MNNVAQAVNDLVGACHNASYSAGWWTHRATGMNLRDVVRSPDNPLEELLAGAPGRAEIVPHSQRGQRSDGGTSQRGSWTIICHID